MNRADCEYTEMWLLNSNSVEMIVLTWTIDKNENTYKALE